MQELYQNPKCPALKELSESRGRAARRECKGTRHGDLRVRRLDRELAVFPAAYPLGRGVGISDTTVGSANVSSNADGIEPPIAF